MSKLRRRFKIKWVKTRIHIFVCFPINFVSHDVVRSHLSSKSGIIIKSALCRKCVRISSSVKSFSQFLSDLFKFQNLWIFLLCWYQSGQKPCQLQLYFLILQFSGKQSLRTQQSQLPLLVDRHQVQQRIWVYELFLSQIRDFRSSCSVDQRHEIHHQRYQPF